MYKLIIADDEISVRDRLSKFNWRKVDLDFCGAFENGVEAYSRLISGDIDIAIIDLNMPVMDGFELVEKINSDAPFLNIIILTAYNDFSYAKRLFGYNVISYLTKPFSDEDVFEAIEKVKLRLQGRDPSDIEYQQVKLINELNKKKLTNIFLKNLSLHKLSAQEIKSEIESNDLVFKEPMYIAVLRSDTDLEQFSDTICTVVEIVLSNYFKDKNIGYFVIHKYEAEITLFLYDMPEKDIFSHLENIKRKLYDAASIVRTTISAVVGGKGMVQDFYLLAENARKGIESRVKDDFIGVYDENSMLVDEQNINYIVKSAMQYIDEHYAEALTLEIIAKEVYISRSHLCRIFHQCTNMRMVDYIMQCRINKAKELMRNPKYTISEIAEMVGYGSARYFSYIFKRAEKVSPNDFRKTL